MTAPAPTEACTALTRKGASTDTTAPAVIVRTRHGLLNQLTAIDVDGWDSSAGTTLLTYVRDTVVHPQVLALGLVGPAAEHAEATAWAMTWRVLSSDGIRDASSPWGILWSAARRAVADETVGAAYGTSGRTAWQRRATHRRQARNGGLDEAASALPPLSFDVLASLGHEPPAPPLLTVAHTPPSALLDQVAACLEDAGWPRDQVASILASVADRVQRHHDHARLMGGWRALATDTGLPGWQARRLTHVLLGTRGWPGIIERLATVGLARTVDETDVRTAIDATREARMTSPDLVARSYSLRTAS